MALSDRELLRRASRGNGDAYEAVYRRHRDAVMAFALRRCESPADALDVVSETFLIALRRARSFRDDAESARPWLIGIAANALSNQRRARSRQARVARAARALPSWAPDEVDAVAAAIDSARRARSLDPAIASLAADDRELLGHIGQGLSSSEAAEAMGVSGAAARVRLTRIRKRLRAALPTNEEV